RATRAAFSSRERYLAHEHVGVSYNGDLRGVVEDTRGVTRRVRCSVASFYAFGAGVADGHTRRRLLVPGRYKGRMSQWRRDATLGSLRDFWWRSRALTASSYRGAATSARPASTSRRRETSASREWSSGFTSRRRTGSARCISWRTSCGR